VVNARRVRRWFVPKSYGNSQSNPAMRSPEPQTFTRRLGALGALLGLLGALNVAACGSDPCTSPQCGAGAGGTTSGGGSGGGSEAARSGPCTSDTTCDTAHGFSCTAGECRYPCRSHYDCEGQGVCDTVLATDGTRVGTYCTLFDEPVPPGQYYTHCPSYTECSADAGFVCLGSGVGDSDAYCSAACRADEDCPTGFFCDAVSDSTGKDALYCVRRRFCAPCETDADCLLVSGQICARDQGGEKICTQLCDTSVDSCPWGNAAICGTWDDELGAATCAHRYGSCHGEGKGCEPCVRDSDCPTGLCYGSSYTGERWCIDTSVDCNCDGLETSQHVCSGGNNCPRSPGGLKMSCFDYSRGEGDPIEYSCLASTSGPVSSPQTGCWEAL
jgi:hypothetical protein